MLFVIMFLISIIINGCAFYYDPSYIHIYDDYSSFTKNDSITVSTFLQGKSVIEASDSVYFSKYTHRFSGGYKNRSLSDFYQLVTTDSLCEFIFVNSIADSVVVYNNGNMYKSIKFNFLDDSNELISVIVCDSLKNCKISNAKHVRNGTFIDLRKSL